VLAALLIPCICDQSCYLELHYGRCVALIVMFRELFHGHVPTNRPMTI
jgi:hypothetical protein